jgi:hypothetical protein
MKSRVYDPKKCLHSLTAADEESSGGKIFGQ